MLSEALDLVSRMIDATPTGRAGVSDSYLGYMAELLCQYPRQIATECADPVRGVLTKGPFYPVPAIHDICKWCDPKVDDLRKQSAKIERREAQLNERDEIERQRLLAPPKKSQQEFMAEFYAEMEGRGLHFKSRPVQHNETPATVMAKLGLTQEQWDALPDGPHSTWQKARI